MESQDSELYKIVFTLKILQRQWCKGLGDPVENLEPEVYIQVTGTKTQNPGFLDMVW